MVAEDAVDVIQLDVDKSILNVQCRLKLFISSAIFEATNNGWHIRPTRRSEAARQPKRTKDGVWRHRVFPIARRTNKFPVHVITENSTFMIHVKKFAVKTPSSVLSKLISLKKKHRKI